MAKPKTARGTNIKSVRGAGTARRRRAAWHYREQQRRYHNLAGQVTTTRHDPQHCGLLNRGTTCTCNSPP